ncbi:unnamed protein product [Adineta steineri]|uniref:Uncharacterized protein n=1 Tax=Adineta steineri TaxID=433720 RepID=A0A813S405_9BILA|nr:unnamed protein product [Adineta steineri]CAF0793773.1 unnamed protein product [Adineta steineri]CAF0797996.1 unnamed protein product [Adineta steineri]
MSFTSKATHIDRDDFAADHYADFVRDSHRTRLTFDQLDMARRQLRKKEELLSQAHSIKMKEHTRIENGFLRKLEQNPRIANLPMVREKLRAQRRQGLESPNKNSSETDKSMGQEDNVYQKTNQFKPITMRPPSAKTERLNANRDKFNQTNVLLC